jgi:hypothetical protein
MRTLTTLFTLAFLVAATSLAHEDEEHFTIVSPAPVPVGDKKAKVIYQNFDKDCAARVTGTLSDTAIADFKKSTGDSKKAVLAHTFKLDAKTPGTVTLTISIDFEDVTKEDAEEELTVTVLPSPKTAEKVIKKAGAEFIKRVKASGKQAVAKLKKSHVTGQTAEELQASTEEFLDDHGDAFGDVHDDFDQACGDFVGEVEGALQNEGFAKNQPILLPKGALLGACGSTDKIWKAVNAEFAKIFDNLDKVVEKELSFAAKKAAESMLVNCVELVATPPRVPVGLVDSLVPRPHPPTLIVKAMTYKTAVGYTFTLLDVTSLLPQGHTAGSFEIWNEFENWVIASKPGESLETHGNVLRARLDNIKLVPGKTYVVSITDPETGVKTKVTVTAPGAS